MKKSLFVGMAVALALSSCGSHYGLTSVSRSRILVDRTFDRHVDAAAETFIAPYKLKVDSVVSPVVGHCAAYMWAEKPESNLSNLLADVLVWAGKDYGEAPVLGLYNIGGIRAALSAGPVTYGNVLDVAPFENKICFFDLSGAAVMQLFREIAHNRGEGVSHGVELVISRDGELLSATLHGEEIDPEKTYRVSSIDFLAQGNDGLTALKRLENLNSPQDESNNMRFIIMDYFREKEAEGVAVDAKVEGRITVKD